MPTKSTSNHSLSIVQSKSTSSSGKKGKPSFTISKKKDRLQAEEKKIHPSVHSRPTRKTCKKTFLTSTRNQQANSTIPSVIPKTVVRPITQGTIALNSSKP